MGYLSLLLGLLLPWLAGFVWLRALERLFKSDSQSHIAAQLGYGFFVGYGILFGCLNLADQLGVLGYWPIIMALTVLVIAGAVTGAKIRSSQQTNSNAPAVQTRQPHPWLFWFLLGLTCLHLLLNTWEVLYRPVYAWDAWTTWIYRAKVWFFSADIYQLASPQAWLADPEGATHAIPAYRYPTFPSVIPLWAVISFGQWSDTLVNTPVIGCGIALALALYGACRDEGLSATFAMAAAYALISLPIVGAHLSLAGYADIWMAGFSGLGFVALLRGLIHASVFNTLLGIGFLAVGICLKNEGLAWLLMGLGLAAIALAASIRSLRLAMLAGLIAVAIAIVLGWTSVELPVLGLLGIKDSILYFPGLGQYQLVTYNVLPIYVESFFARSGWHLLWALTVLALVGLTFVRSKRLSSIVFSFYLLFAASQLLIFGATENGLFAELNTAINRLVIHFLPALVFAIVLVVYQLAEHWFPELQEANESSDVLRIRPWLVAAPLSSIALVMAGVWIVAALTPPSTNSAGSDIPPSVSFQPQNFAPVMGGGQIEAGSLVIDRFDRGMAIASKSGLSIDTKHYPFLDYDLEIVGSSTAMFFWRNADTPESIQMILIDPSANSTMYIADHPNWGEPIIELGFVAYGVSGDAYRLSELSLNSWSSTDPVELLIDDWFTYEPITQKFINWIDGGRKLQLFNAISILSLSLVLLVSTLTVLRAMKRPASRYASPINLLAMALVLWLIADAVWLKNRLMQSYATKEVYGDRINIKRNERANEGFPFHGVASAIQPFVSENDEILVLPQTERMWFEAARLNLQLAPAESYARKSGIRAIPKNWNNLILIVRDPRQESDNLREQVSTQTNRRFTVSFKNAYIMLLKPAK